MLIFAQNKGHGINQKLVDKKEKKTVDGSQKVSKYDFLEGAGEKDKEDRGGSYTSLNIVNSGNSLQMLKLIIKQKRKIKVNPNIGNK